MSYSVIPTPLFKKEAKKLLKKYASLKNELQSIEKTLLQNPSLGTHLGQGIYKIRIAIKSKMKGKSGGARVITYVVTDAMEIYLLTIYDKSDLDSIDIKTLKTIVFEIQKNRKS